MSLDILAISFFFSIFLITCILNTKWGWLYLLFVAFSEQVNWKVITVPAKGFVRFLGNTCYCSICRVGDLPFAPPTKHAWIYCIRSSHLSKADHSLTSGGLGGYSDGLTHLPQLQMKKKSPNPKAHFLLNCKENNLPCSHPVWGWGRNVIFILQNILDWREYAEQNILCYFSKRT